VQAGSSPANAKGHRRLDGVRLPGGHVPEMRARATTTVCPTHRALVACRTGCRLTKCWTCRARGSIVMARAITIATRRRFPHI